MPEAQAAVGGTASRKGRLKDLSRMHGNGHVRFSRGRGGGNAALLPDRAVRQGVLWRKGSLFTQNQRGQEYVERLLTVKTTLRQQGGKLLEFLTESLRAARTGAPAPKVFAPLCA